MIEKLERLIREEDGVKISCPPDNEHIMHKINALIDAVNELQQKVGISKIENTTESTQDPYAEQRKWIGKLCWFWDWEREKAVTGILTDLVETGPRFIKYGLYFYEHCEPVKPDDDIIYKGGSNE